MFPVVDVGCSLPSSKPSGIFRTLQGRVPRTVVSIAGCVSYDVIVFFWGGVTTLWGFVDCWYHSNRPYLEQLKVFEQPSRP